MSSILDQLGLDHTFFIQMVFFAALFLVLKPLYFQPFLKLIQLRHERTVEDREAAEKMMTQAEAKLREYNERLQQERLAAKKEYDAVIDDARKQEAQLLAHAREEAKKITQEAAESVSRQRDQLKKQLIGDVEELAKGISERLLSRKV